MSSSDSSVNTDDRPFHKGQRVCRVAWSDGQPVLRFGTVTKTTKTTYYVDDMRGTDWYASVRNAIDEEYLSVFRDWDTLFGSRVRSKGWTISDTVRCVCRLRRMERRLIRRNRLS